MRAYIVGEVLGGHGQEVPGRLLACQDTVLPTEQLKATKDQFSGSLVLQQKS